MCKTKGLLLVLMGFVLCFSSTQVAAQSYRPIEEHIHDFGNGSGYSDGSYHTPLVLHTVNLLDLNPDPVTRPEVFLEGSLAAHWIQIRMRYLDQQSGWIGSMLSEFRTTAADGPEGGTFYNANNDSSYIPALWDAGQVNHLLPFDPINYLTAGTPSQIFPGSDNGIFPFKDGKVNVGIDLWNYLDADFEGLRLPSLGRVPLEYFKWYADLVTVTSDDLGFSDLIRSASLSSAMPDYHFFTGYSEYDEFLKNNYGLDTLDLAHYEETRKDYNGMGASVLARYEILPVQPKTAITVELNEDYKDYRIIIVAPDTMMVQENFRANSTRISGELGYWDNGSGEKMAFSWYALDLEAENGKLTFYEDFPFLLLLNGDRLTSSRFENYKTEVPYGIAAYLGNDMGMSNPLTQNPFPLMEDVDVEPFLTSIYDMPNCIPLECENPNRMHGSIGVEMDASDLRMYYLATDFAAEQLLEEDGYYSTWIRPAGKGSNDEIYHLYRMDGRWDTLNGSAVQDPFLPNELVYFDLTDYGPWPLIDSTALNVNHRTRRAPVGAITAEVKGTNFQLKELKVGEKFYYHTITSLNTSTLQTYDLTNSDITALSKAGGLLKVFVNPGEKFYAVASALSQFSLSGTDQAQYNASDWSIVQKEALFQARDGEGHTKDFYLYEITCHHDSYLIKMKADGPMVIGNDVQIQGPKENAINTFLYDKGNSNIDYIVCAHRGFWRDPGVPENNIPAFNASLNLGITSGVIEKDGVHRVNMIELDVKLTKDAQLVLFHDDQLWRLSSLMDNMNLQPSELQNLEGTLISKINWNNPTTKMAIQKKDGSGNIYVNLPPLKNARPKDRFGNVVDIGMMSLEEALLFLKEKDVMIALDKITGQITRVFEAALRTDTEDLILLKGNAESYNPDKLQKSFGIVMDQIFYTPYLFSETTYTNSDGDLRDSYQTIQDFIEKDNWNIPGFEVQLKTGYSSAPAYKQDMNMALRNWARDNQGKYWIGITSVTPSSIDKVDVKQLYDNCTPEDMVDPKSSKASSCSNYDWRADWAFCLDYVHANYFITDRPELTLQFLQNYILTY